MEAASLLDAVERWSEPLAAAAIVVFSCVLGANLGSFLNVVMYRVPRGESVALGGSRCPSCGSRVRWRDNVPVIGWLLLGGRCRDCRGAISVRYPVIEAAAGMVGAVVAGELLAGGRLMPGSRFAAVRPGADALLTLPDWSFVMTCVAHGALLMTLLAWAVCEFDRLRVAWSWFAAALAAWVGTSICLGGPTVPAGSPAVAMVGAGIGAGLMAGALVPSVWLRQCLVLVGAALGWQALLTAVAIMPLAAVVRIAVASGVGQRTLRATGPGCVDLALAVAVQVLAWRWLDGIWIGQGPAA